MAKIYGRRWKTVRHLQTGGQSEVFAVIDMHGEYYGEYALKRVLNPKRHDRFRNEVEAIKRLNHPNIIKLIDHSDLDEQAKNSEKYYFVMPIAKGGDLSQRAAIYKDSIDTVLPVAKQIASALLEAHRIGIVHRDIKPQNILFTNVGHEILVSDFGICLVRQEIRPTETKEIVGPWAFMAPELEDGGRLDATAAADVYSLGKVIYYMISGGTVLPRERLYEKQHKALFSKGERYTLLEILLGNMICSLEIRHQDMDQVIADINRIQEWEVNARLAPVSPQTISILTRLQQQALEDKRLAGEAKVTDLYRSQMIAAVKKGVFDWLKVELSMAASVIQSSDALTSKVNESKLQEAYDEENKGVSKSELAVGKSQIKPIDSGIELTIERSMDEFDETHILQFFLFREDSRIATQSLDLFLIPYYHYKFQNNLDSWVRHRHGFLLKKREIERQYLFSPERIRAIRNLVWRIAYRIIYTSPPKYPDVTVPVGISDSFGERNMFAKFRLSEWPGCSESLQSELIETIDTFVHITNRNSDAPHILGRDDSHVINL